MKLPANPTDTEFNWASIGFDNDAVLAIAAPETAKPKVIVTANIVLLINGLFAET
ncbi:hypothetical protein ACJU26_09215 [Acidithiobacillus sp. M4-SHS-6]|uniref:hypothetical protein n=1 Tax=Acidithiobacillus sp. M4-SHS-6 TaxID=3383024 RepID=UPI0039BE99FE